MSEPKIEPWIEKLADRLMPMMPIAHYSCNQEYNQKFASKRSALIDIIVQEHAPSSPAAPNVKKEEACIGDFAVGAIAAPCIATQESVPIVGESILVNCSPAAPTPHMSAAEHFEKWVGKAYPNMDYDSAEEIAVKFAEAYAASETARADRAEQLEADLRGQIKDWRQACHNRQARAELAEADLQRKDAAMRVALEWAANYPLKGFGSEEDGRAARQTYDVIEAALAPISVPAAPEVTTPATPEKL